jgi:glycosyltransferase involved in cell wall biosynthesis
VTTRRPEVAFVLSDTPWPPTSGGDLRNVSLARSIAAVGALHPILFPLRSDPDPARLPLGSQVHPTGLDGSPSGRIARRAVGTVRGRHPFLERIEATGGIDRLCRDLDEMGAEIVVLTYPFLGRVPRMVRRPGRQVIVDLDTSHELTDRRRLRASTGVTQRLQAALDVAVARRMESDPCRSADEIWVVSEIGAQDLGKRHRGVQVRVVPNTIDVRSYARYRDVDHIVDRLVFVGSLHYGPNADAARWTARQLMPVLRKRRPMAELTVVGRSGPSDLTAELAQTPGVRLVLDAPDAWAVASRAGPLVVPIQSGGGSRFKVLEAAASGVPIISTRLGMEGLDFEPGRHYLAAEGPASFADALDQLWSDQASATRLSDAALEFTETHYDQAVGDRIVADALSNMPADRVI